MECYLLDFTQGRCIGGVLLGTSERRFAKEVQNHSQTDFLAFANAKKSIYCFDLGLHVAVEIVSYPEHCCKRQAVKI